MATRCARARALVVVLAVAGTTGARGGVPVAVQFDVAPAFNADVLLNYHDSSFDSGVPLEDQYLLPTHSAAAATLCGLGLPDGGEAAQVGFLPRLQFEYRNGDDGYNAWFSGDQSSGQVTIAVKPLRYQEVHLLGTSGVHGNLLTVTFHYDTGADTVFHTGIPHWTDAPGGSVYVIFTVTPRAVSGFCSPTDVNVYGLRLPADDSRTLVSFTLAKDFFGALALLGAIGIPAQTATNLDISSIFTNDVIANYTTAMDTAQDSFDDVGTILLTDSAAAALGCGPGLPNSGAFTSGLDHPAVQLGFNNASFGNNAHMITGTSDEVTIFPPQGHYDQVHLFATCSSGGRNEAFSLNYLTGAPTTGAVTIPDWSDVSDYSGTPVYGLSPRMDRATSTLANNCEDRNDLSLFGAIINADPSRTLDNISLSAVSSAARMGIFGITLMKSHPYLFEDGFESATALVQQPSAAHMWTAVMP